MTFAFSRIHSKFFMDATKYIHSFNSNKIKSCTKTSLAFAITYAIAFNLSWMNPYWAGFAVAMVAMVPESQSINKGVLRVAGTMIGACAGLFVYSLAPQNRGVFLLLIVLWAMLCGYLMQRDKKHPYMWHVAGYVCMIVVMASPSDSSYIFQRALFRTMETLLGVTVYTTVLIFLWPSTNQSSLGKLIEKFTENQKAYLHSFFEKGSMKKRQQLDRAQFTLIRSIEAINYGENIESHEVLRSKRYWLRYIELARASHEQLNRFSFTLQHVEKRGLERRKRLDILLETLESRRCDGADELDTRQAGVLQNSFNALLKSFILMNQIRFEQSRAEPITEEPSGWRYWADPDTLRGTAYVGVVVALGFSFWILFDPPGHSGWFEMATTLGIAVASDQLRSMKSLVIPSIYATIVCFILYTTVMPRFSSYMELGPFLFLSMFVCTYFFTGVPRFAVALSILTMMPLSNQQSYDAAKIMNSLLFNVIFYLGIHWSSYLLHSPRPEKKFLQLIERFQCSVEYVLSAQKRSGFFYHHHLYEVKSLSEKMVLWSEEVSKKKYFSGHNSELYDFVFCARVLGQASLRYIALAHENGSFDPFTVLLGRAGEGKKGQLLLLGEEVARCVEQSQPQDILYYRRKLLHYSLTVYLEKVDSFPWDFYRREVF